jgi:hypothetical protein
VGERFYVETFTPEVREAQRHYNGRDYQPDAPEREALGPAEMEWIARRDHFYLATVNSAGWPYVQHRGGPPGFLRALDPHTLAFADFKGNKQLISTGNIASGGKVALLLMDYAERRRLKVLGTARTADVRSLPHALEGIAAPEFVKRTERLVVIDVVAFDWNCPAYITPRYTEAELNAT